MKTEVNKEWCENMAKLEDGGEIGAGSPGHPLRIVLRGMDAIAAAERGDDLYVACADGWLPVAPDRRAWVLARARNKRSKVSIGLFGSTGTRFDAWGGVYRDGRHCPDVSN